MSAKFNRAQYEPGWIEITIGALLSVVVGVVFGAVYMVMKPVVTVKELPREEEREHGAVYFVEGARDAARAKLLVAKRKTLVGGGSVAVDENELNLLTTPTAPAPSPAAPGPAAKGGKADAKKGKTAANTPTPAQAAAPVAKSAPPPPPAIVGAGYTAGAPNFRIRDGLLQIGVPVNVDVFGVEISVLVQTQGTFVKSGGTFAFEPETLWVGSCPIDRLPVARDFVMKKVINPQPVPDDIQNAWSKLAGVSVVGSVLRLTMP